MSDPKSADDPIVDQDAVSAAEDAAMDAAAEAALDDAEKLDVSDLFGPEAEIEALTAERDELKDRLMRALADAENARKRGERDRKDAETYGGTKLARDLLSVHDNMARALATVTDEMREVAGPMIEGVELTQRELLAAFAKHKITEVNPDVGAKFDPKLHQAMFEAPVPNAPAGTIIQVMNPGFVIADRLLRAAQVGVAAQPPAPAPEPEPEDAAEETAEADAKDETPDAT